MSDYQLPKNKITADRARLISTQRKDQRVNEIFEYNLNLVYEKINQSSQKGYDSAFHFIHDSFILAELSAKKIESMLIQDGYVVHGGPGVSGGYALTISW